MAPLVLESHSWLCGGSEDIWRGLPRLEEAWIKVGPVSALPIEESILVRESLFSAISKFSLASGSPKLKQGISRSGRAMRETSKVVDLERAV